jgi:hypothetical protein
MLGTVPTALANGQRRARRLLPDFLAKFRGRRLKNQPATRPRCTYTLTTAGKSAGNPTSVLLIHHGEDPVFAYTLTSSEVALMLEVGIPYIHLSMLTGKERGLVRNAYRYLEGKRKRSLGNPSVGQQ